MRIRTSGKKNNEKNPHTLIECPRYTTCGLEIYRKFSEKKVHCSQASSVNKSRLDDETNYQSNTENLLHINRADQNTQQFFYRFQIYNVSSYEKIKPKAKTM